MATITGDRAFEWRYRDLYGEWLPGGMLHLEDIALDDDPDFPPGARYRVLSYEQEQDGDDYVLGFARTFTQALQLARRELPIPSQGITKIRLSPSE